MEDPAKAGIHSDTRFKLPEEFCDSDPSSVVKALAQTNVSEAVQDVVLHSRELGLRAIPENMNRLAAWGEVADAVMAYEISQGIETSYSHPFPPPPTPEPKKPKINSPTLASRSFVPPMPASVTKVQLVPEVSAPAHPPILKEPEKKFAPCAYSSQQPPLTHVSQEMGSGVSPPLQHIPYAHDPGVNLPITSLHYNTSGMQAPTPNLVSSYSSFTSPSPVFSAGSNESGYVSGQIVSPPSISTHLPSPAGSTNSYTTGSPSQGYSGPSPSMESVSSSLSQVPPLPVNGMVYIPNMQVQQPQMQDSLSNPHLQGHQPPSAYGYPPPSQAPLNGSQVYHPPNGQQLPMKYDNQSYYPTEGPNPHPMMPPMLHRLPPQAHSSFTVTGTFSTTNSNPVANVSGAAPTEDEVMEILQQFMP